jgi:hypothetical protein
VRIDLPNPDLQLRPGMYVNANLSVDLGEGLTVPINAVVPTGSRNIIFLDKGDGKLLPRMVQLGSQVGDAYQVLSGLKEGDRIVSSANFLIDAESQVQGALQGLEPETAPPSPEETGHLNGLGQNSKEPFDSLLKDYSVVQQQLAQDKTDQARDLEMSRLAFGKISAALITLLADYSPPLTRDWQVMMCPRWKKSPARWLQTDQEIHNPFLGTALPNCGQTIGSIGTVNLKAIR